MNINKLMYGPPREVADMLGTENDVTQEDLSPALINALNRIDNLEKQMKRLLVSLDE